MPKPDLPPSLPAAGALCHPATLGAPPDGRTALGDLDPHPALIDELAGEDALTPAQLGAARKLVDLQPEALIDTTVREGVAAIRQLLHGIPAPHPRENATAFGIAYLNLAGGIAPNALVRALECEGQSRLKLRFFQILR